MNYRDAKILQQQATRANECRGLLEELHKQREALVQIVVNLEQGNRKKLSELKKIQGMSLISVFYSLRGVKESKLNEARREAENIKVKYEASAMELECLEERIRKTEDELSVLGKCESDFHAYLESGYERIKATEKFSEIEVIEIEHAGLVNSFVTVNEAIALGKKLKWDIHNMLIMLNILEETKADIRVAKAGSVARMYEYIDKIQAAIVKLRDKLAAFCEMLKELSIEEEITVDTDAFMQVLDVPMSALVADDISKYLAIMDKVMIVSKNFQPVKDQVEEALQKVTELESDIEQKMKDVQKKLEDKIIELAD